MFRSPYLEASVGYQIQRWCRVLDHWNAKCLTRKAFMRKSVFEGRNYAVLALNRNAEGGTYFLPFT
jgi:hypothetical protein